MKKTQRNFKGTEDLVMDLLGKREGMKKKTASSEVVVDGLYQSVRKIIEQGRKAVSVAANAVLVRQNWAIGKLIVEDEPRARLRRQERLPSRPRGAEPQGRATGREG